MRATARAFAPGHVTGVFRPASSSRDPRGVGSIGAGLVLATGSIAEARWESGKRRSLTVEGPSGEPLPITEAAVDHLLGTHTGRLEVRVAPSLPVGQGFGMSAAGTLAACLATGGVLPLSRDRLVQTAHLADLLGRGGLGGVSAILGGGLEVRRQAGVPPFGEVLHRPWSLGPILLVRAGAPVPSPTILGSPRWLTRIERASEGLEGLVARPTPEGFLRLSERFTDRLRLGPPSLTRAIRALRRTGCHVAQAMFGTTLFVVPVDGRSRAGALELLTSRRLPAVEVEVARRGARRLPTPRQRGALPSPKDFRGGTVRREP